jgi:hypothetical protein
MGLIDITGKRFSYFHPIMVELRRQGHEPHIEVICGKVYILYDQ